MHREDLLYSLEYKVANARENAIDRVKYDGLTIKELLDLGFNNAYLISNYEHINLGYKWFDYKQEEFGYNSEDFGELNEQQLNVYIEYYDSYLTDDDYMNINVKLVNDEDIKYFVKEVE